MGSSSWSISWPSIEIDTISSVPLDHGSKPKSTLNKTSSTSNRSSSRNKWCGLWSCLVLPWPVLSYTWCSSFEERDSRKKLTWHTLGYIRRYTSTIHPDIRCSALSSLLIPRWLMDWLVKNSFGLWLWILSLVTASKRRFWRVKFKNCNKAIVNTLETLNLPWASINKILQPDIGFFFKNQ